MQNYILKFLMSALLIVNLIACSSEDSNSKNTSKDKKVPNYNTKSCDFGLTEGEHAEQGLIGSSEITKVYFDKEFNINYLKAIESANVEDTISFINQTGVTVFKSNPVETALCSKSLFAGASKLPIDLQNKWDSVNKSEEKSESFILGLYLPKNNSNLMPTLNSKAAIIVRENTNRWTITHEFMHHLFMTREVEKGYNDEKEKEKFLEVYTKFREVLERKDLTESEQKKAAAEPFVDFFESTDNQLVHYTLEEMAIEAILKDAHSNNKLHYAPINSNWYVYSSAKTAKKTYSVFSKLGEEILLELKKPSDKKIKSNIYGVLKKIENRIDEIDKITLKYPYDESLYLQNGNLVNSEDLYFGGCSHYSQGEEILKILSKIKFLSK